MKNTLWSFGCSFSEDFRERIFNFKDDRWDDAKKLYSFYHDLYGIDNLKSWQYYISEPLNLNTQIFGWGGGSNYQIFESICNESHNFKKGDIVIVEWTIVSRTRIPINKTDSCKWSPISVNCYPDTDMVDSSFFDKLMLIRDSNAYKEEINYYINLLKTLSKQVGFTLIFWTIDSQFLQYIDNCNLIDDYWLAHEFVNSNKFPHWSYTSFFKTLGAQEINEETNYKHEDPHFGQQGNKIIGEYFKKYIDENISYRG